MKNSVDFLDLELELICLNLLTRSFQRTLYQFRTVIITHRLSIRLGRALEIECIFKK